MDGPWAAAATPAAEVTHLKARLQRFSGKKRQRLPAFRRLSPTHQSHFPRSAPEFRLEVFRLIGEGLNTAEIAEQLHLRVKTIENYRDRIRQ